MIDLVFMASDEVNEGLKPKQVDEVKCRGYVQMRLF